MCYQKLGDGRPKPHGTWDYFGECDPAYNKFNFKTFSVGVFQWCEKKSRGTKKLPIVQRIKGYTSSPGLVYEKALALIVEKENANKT